MSTEVFQCALVLALAFALVQCTATLLGGARRDPALISVGQRALVGQFAAAAVALAGVIVGDVGAGATPTQKAARPGNPLPTIALPGLDGETSGLASADLAGRVSLVNVFASWCSVCRSEHPMLMQIAGESDVPLYGINWKDRPDQARKWLADNRSPYRKIGADGGDELGDALGVTGVPETLVIDRRGDIRHRHVGAITSEVWKGTLRPLIAALRAEP